MTIWYIWATNIEETRAKKNIQKCNHTNIWTPLCPNHSQNGQTHQAKYIYSRPGTGVYLLLCIWFSRISNLNQISKGPYFYLHISGKIFNYFFGPLYGFIDRTAEDTTGNRIRERGSDPQQRAPGQDSNLGLLQRGRSGDARSTNWAQRRPISGKVFAFSLVLSSQTHDWPLEDNCPAALLYNCSSLDQLIPVLMIHKMINTDWPGGFIVREWSISNQITML